MDIIVMHLVFLFESITKWQYGPDLGPEPLTQGDMNFTIFFIESYFMDITTVNSVFFPSVWE